MIFLFLTPAYRSIINPVNPITNTLPISGMSTNTKNIITWTIRYFLTISRDCKSGFLRINHRAKNITYHILKNSAGCMEGSQGIFNHHLAPFRDIHIPGIKTNIWNKRINTLKIVRNLLFFNAFNGKIYTITHAPIARTRLISCLKK